MIKIYKYLFLIFIICNLLSYADDLKNLDSNNDIKEKSTEIESVKEKKPDIESKKMDSSVAIKSTSDTKVITTKVNSDTGVIITAKNCDKVEPCMLVSDVSRKIFSLINGASDDSDVADLIINVVVPKFNFDLITKYALGTNWKIATKSQQTTLVELFKNLLIYAYSTAISKLRNAKITIIDSKIINKEKAEIYTQFLLPDSPSSQAIKVEYDFAKSDNISEWKVYDVKIEDISLVSNYREQFTNTVVSDGIGGLIKQLETKIATLQKKKLVKNNK